MHAVTGAAGAAFTVSLAGSLFFNVSVNAARPRILLYLLSTLAPFALVVPLLAPLTDRFRGGYRAIIVATAIGKKRILLEWLRQLKINLAHSFKNRNMER